MSEKITAGRTLAWLKQPTRFVDLVGALLVTYLVYIAWSLLKEPGDFLHLVLLGIVVFSALRIAYELTVNRRGVPTLATGFLERRKIAAILKRDAEARGARPYRVIDLGSGRGELARHIAHAVPQAQVLGLEQRFVPHHRSKIFQRILGPKNVEFKRLDFTSYDCSGVDAIVMYLSAKLAKEVGKKLRQELKPGTLVVSHAFELDDAWQPVETIKLKTFFKTELFVYRA